MILSTKVKEVVSNYEAENAEIMILFVVKLVQQFQSYLHEPLNYLLQTFVIDQNIQSHVYWYLISYHVIMKKKS